MLSDPERESLGASIALTKEKTILYRIEKIVNQQESLILAQDERWRRA